MRKAYIDHIFYEINNHKPFKKKPYVHYTTRTPYAARSEYAASLGRRCQFVKIYLVTHNPLHIHRILVDECKF